MTSQSSRAAIRRPQIKATAIPVPLSGRRLALHRGPFKAEHQLMVLPDPVGLIEHAMGKMDGSRTVADIARALQDDGIDVTESDLHGVVEMLADRGVVADAQTLAVSGLGVAAERYSRNLNCWAALADGRTAVEMQASIGRAHVLILGVGGIGTGVATSLAMAGCGKLTLVDFDLVELSNLNRQLLFTVEDIGEPKVDIAKARLQRVNPDVTITTIKTRLESAEQIHDVIKSVRPNFVANAVDRPTVAIDRWINSACFAEDVPYCANSVSGHTATFWTKIPGQTGCYACDDLWAAQRSRDHLELKNYREQHDLIAATSALSFTAMTIGSLTASEIIRYVLKWPLTSAGRTILVDFSTLRLTEYDRPAHPDCQICGGLVAKAPSRTGTR